jgi:hypothetical protein
VILASAVDVNSNAPYWLCWQNTGVLFVIFGTGLFFAGRMFAQKALSPVDKIIIADKEISGPATCICG